MVFALPSPISTTLIALFFFLSGGIRAQEMEVRGQPFNHGNPTQYEQYLLELINRARANPAAEAARYGIGLNQGLPANSISNTPKPPLASNPLLIQAARNHSSWMLNTGNFSHQGSGGSDPHARMSAAGYDFTGFWSYAENIAWGGTSGTPDHKAVTLARHEGLFRSPGHRQNILNGTYQEIGLGVVAGTYSNLNSLMVTQDYATSDATPASFLVGVIYEDANGNDFYDPGEGLPNVIIAPTEGNWHAVSSSSGGYAVPYQGINGTLSIQVGGGVFTDALTFGIPKTGSNLKLDVNASNIAIVRFAEGSISVSPSTGFRASIIGTEGTAFDLQYSRNLVDWSTVSSYNLGNSSLQVAHKPNNASRGHFYRLQWSR